MPSDSGSAAVGGTLRTRRRGGAVALLLAACITVVPAASGWPGEKQEQEKEQERRSVKDLPENWRIWIAEEVYPLITKDQKRAFLALDTEAQRQAFADRLWMLWGRQTGYGSGFRWLYSERLAFVRAEFESTTEDRARVLLIQGPPVFRFASKCTEFFAPLEIWGWPYIEGLGEDVVVLFYQAGGTGRFRMWYGTEGRRALYATMVGAESRGVPYGASVMDSPRYRCPDGDTLMNLMAAAEMWSRDASYLAAMTEFRPVDRQGEEGSAGRFMEFSALVDAKAEPLPFEVREESWGAEGGLVHMGFAVSVAGQGLGTTAVGDINVVQLDVIGEVSRQSQMVDRFRYVFSMPAADDTLGLVFERFLRPGDYTLRLKVEDVHSKKASVAERAFTASTTPTGEPPGGAAAAASAVVGTADALVAVDLTAAEQPLLKLVGPEGEAVSGIHRFEAVVREEVRRVRFTVNGEEILVKNRAPFDVDLDLGALPRLTTVAAIGYDAAGGEIARDQIALNVGRERFYLRLLPISPGETRDGKVRVAVEVNVPSDAELQQVEMYWSDTLLATDAEPPFEAWVTLEGGGDFGYLRAVATMTDGRVAEDLQFVNAPEFGTVVEVTAVELPVTVYDKNDRPVESLQQEDFRVREDGVEQAISHFSLHRDLPVRLGIVIDTSGSMEKTLPTVQRVVMGFLRDLLRPQDRAFIETFSDRPDLLAPFTADFGTLENALLALYPDRETALYDSVIMGLFQFSGVRGRKAMVVLTDGEDNASRRSFDDVVSYAQRAGVTIYTVGIDLPATKVVPRWQLAKLAEVTGGQSFFVSGDSALDKIYAEIDRELRTQYLLAYTSSSERAPDQLRKIEVDLTQKKYKVRTISGYYPGGV
jgi:VWFA-related protein